jgi:hypothetical protein
MSITALRTGEGIIYDEDSNLDETEQSEKTGETEPDETNDQENTNTKVHQLNNTSDQEIATSPEATEFENVEELIAQLPDNFPLAVETIKDEIGPIIVNYDPGLVDHYITVIKKKTNAPSKRSVQLLVDEIRKQLNTPESDLEMDEEDNDDEPIDPAVKKLADQIAHDPMLFKNRIDIVNKLGVVGEQKNIGLYFLAIDSCKLPMGIAGSEALALKNSGHYGAGKSFPMFMCLKLYSKNSYHLITSGSDKSLFNIEDGLKHKALILTEALALESNGKRDNELAYSIRTLVSEGQLKYQYTGFRGKKRVTIVKKMEGPTSLLTTTIKGKLEDQLEDRLISAHPNTSAKQTQDIISRTADLASGIGNQVDEKTIKAWRLFNDSLDSVEIIIPFAIEISDFVNKNKSISIAARRAFKRVLSAIKTITLLYQKQRDRDGMGRVIAEYSDYAIAFQLINDSFRESLGERKRYTDERIKLIENHGKISPKDLSKITSVSVSAISQWIKPWIAKGVLTWCDDKDDEFEDTKTLEKAKRSGKVFIRVKNFNRLPTPYELTGDKRWDTDGDLYRKFDLGIDEEPFEDFTKINEKEELTYALEETFWLSDMAKSQNPKNEDQGVKVLRQNDDIKNENTKEEIDTDEGIVKENADDLTEEFNEILSPEENHNKRGEHKDQKPVILPNGLMTI